MPAEVGGGTAQGWSSADVGGKTLRLPVDGVHQADGVGHVTLWLGRPAEPDELYWASGSAFAEGEPLHCSGVEGMRAQEAEQVVTRLGYEVSWFTAVDISDGPESPGVETNPVKRARKGRYRVPRLPAARRYACSWSPTMSRRPRGGLKLTSSKGPTRWMST